jgi:hypothetical protein
MGLLTSSPESIKPKSKQANEPNKINILTGKPSLKKGLKGIFILESY